jgi:hypothetical protein
VGIIGNYDHNVARWLTSQSKAIVEDATPLPPSQTCAVQQQGQQYLCGSHLAQLDATPLNVKTRFSTDNGTPIATNVCASYEDATPIMGVTCLVQQQGTFMDMALHAKSDQASPIDAGICAVMQQMTKVRPDKWQLVVQDSGVVRHDIARLVYLEPPLEYRYTPNGDFTFDSEPYIPDAQFQFLFGLTGFVVSQHTVGLMSSCIHSSWQIATKMDIKRCVLVDKARRPPPGKSVWIDIPRPDPPDVPPTGTTYTVPIQEVSLWNILKM